MHLQALEGKSGAVSLCSHFFFAECIFTDINLLLTEREGCTGKYWPEVMVV